MPEKYFNVEGIATFVHHLGPTTLPEVVPDLSRGETVVCLHGAGGNGAVFAELMAALGERHSPLAFDQPGHARSGGIDSLGSIDAMRGFLVALLDRLGVERAVLVGHSMGGAVAMRAALDAPARVRALVLVGTGTRLGLPDELLLGLRKITEGKARREFLRDAYSPATPPELLRKGFMEDLKTDPRVMYGDMVACGDWRVAGELDKIAAPTLVAVGDDELPHLRADADELAAGIANARLATFEKAGHMLPLEQPAALGAEIVRFLEDA